MVGVVHWGAVIEGGHGHVGSVATQAMVLPDMVHVSNALQRFKSDRQQMAIVVDEHGSVDGIVTLEDLLEEIVRGNLGRGDPDDLGVQRDPDGSILLAGTFPIHDLTDIGVELETAPQGTAQRLPVWSSVEWADFPSSPATSSRLTAGRPR